VRFRVQGGGSRVCFRVQNLGVVLGFRVSVFGFRFSVFGFRVSGLGVRDQCEAVPRRALI